VLLISQWISPSSVLRFALPMLLVSSLACGTEAEPNAPQGVSPLDAGEVAAQPSPAGVADLLFGLIVSSFEDTRRSAVDAPEKQVAGKDNDAEAHCPRRENPKVEGTIAPTLGRKKKNLVSAGTSPDPAPEIDSAGDASGCPEGSVELRGQCVPNAWLALYLDSAPEGAEGGARWP